MIFLSNQYLEVLELAPSPLPLPKFSLFFRRTITNNEIALNLLILSRPQPKPELILLKVWKLCWVLLWVGWRQDSSVQVAQGWEWSGMVGRWSRGKTMMG